LALTVLARSNRTPSYHPAVLLKLYIYGHLNRVQSSRRLEREASRNVEPMCLTDRLAPDHKTIANFRKDNGCAIRQVCAQFVTLCRQMSLLSTASLAIDGSKFKAVNNRDPNYTRAKLGNTIVPRAIRAFQAKHPDIALTLQVHPTTRVCEVVGSGEFYIGLAADEVDLSGVEHRTFGSFKAVCAISPGHPLSADRRSRLRISMACPLWHWRPTTAPVSGSMRCLRLRGCARRLWSDVQLLDGLRPRARGNNSKPVNGRRHATPCVSFEAPERKAQAKPPSGETRPAPEAYTLPAQPCHRLAWRIREQEPSAPYPSCLASSLS
jgi:transposase